MIKVKDMDLAAQRQGESSLILWDVFYGHEIFHPLSFSSSSSSSSWQGKIGDDGRTSEWCGLLRLKKITLRVFSVSIYTISSLRAPIYVREMLHSRGERFTLLFISSLAPFFVFTVLFGLGVEHHVSSLANKIVNFFCRKLLRQSYLFGQIKINT